MLKGSTAGIAGKIANAVGNLIKLNPGAVWEDACREAFQSELLSAIGAGTCQSE